LLYNATNASHSADGISATDEQRKSGCGPLAAGSATGWARATPGPGAQGARNANASKMGSKRQRERFIGHLLSGEMHGMRTAHADPPRGAMMGMMALAGDTAAALWAARPQQDGRHQPLGDHKCIIAPGPRRVKGIGS
jgi:hypothetical protein